MFNLPVTIVAGYLGSGKTKYINQKLADASGIRYGVLVNDFGELNIDTQLIASETTKTISLNNGCICCSIANDMDSALDELKSFSHLLDWVLLEASGVADPQRIQNQVKNWPGFELAELITIVDATRIRKLVKDKFVGEHVRAQLIQAVKIVVSKVDLLCEVSTNRLKVWLQNYRSEDWRESDISGHAHFYSQTYLSTQPVNKSQLVLWLAHPGEGVERIKGFVLVENEPESRYLLQWVDGSWVLESLGPWTEEAKTSLVLISTNESSRFPLTFS